MQDGSVTVNGVNEARTFGVFAGGKSVYTESVKRILNAVEKQLPNMPKGPKAREIAIGTLEFLIGTLQMARAVDDPFLSKAILTAGSHVACTLIQSEREKHRRIVTSE